MGRHHPPVFFDYSVKKNMISAHNEGDCPAQEIRLGLGPVSSSCNHRCFAFMKSAKPRQPLSAPAASSRNRRHLPKRALHVTVRRSAVLESTVKLTVNLLLAVVAGATLTKLVPYYQSQRQDLQALQQTLQTVEQENQTLRQDFSRTFDPRQTSSVMQEQSAQSDPRQRTVVWVNPLQSQP
jgi:hypothetical protein